MKLAAAVLCLLAVVGVIWGGLALKRVRGINRAQDDAVMLARTWSEGADFAAWCRAAEAAGARGSLRERWDPGSGDEPAHGPIVAGQRVVVRSDRSIQWRSAP